MPYIHSSVTPARRAAAVWRPAILAAGLAVGLGACDSLLEVDNPNNVLQEDVESPDGASALVNGSLARTADALSEVLLAHVAVTDEYLWVGSQNGVGELDKGILSNYSNGFVSDGFNNLSAARWLADEAIRLFEGFDAEGTAFVLKDLGRAYLYSGINYTTIADMWDDFTFSDRREPGPPVGVDNMHTVYDTAIERFDRAIAVFQETGDEDLELAALAMRARAKWAKALWGKLNPKGSVDTADPLIDDAGANADAAQVLAMAPEADWMFRFYFSGDSQENEIAGWINSRQELVVDPIYAQADETGLKICSPSNEDCPENGIVLLDPIDGIKDPALAGIIFEFIEGFEHPPLTVVTAREMHLILAEAALKQGDMGAFATHVNAVRALEEDLTPYDPGDADPLELLKHERRVNLFLQVQRRLADMYRFGETSDEWVPNAEARTVPGTFFLIGYEESLSNCYILGTC